MYMLGSLVCEGVGSICLGTKSVTLKKKKWLGKRKNKEKRREREKRICLNFINKSISLHLWSDWVEIWRRGLKVKYLQSERWRSDFELGNWCYCQWTIRRFWYTFSNFLCFSQNRLYNPRLYVLLMYLAASRVYFREDRCNPLLLIVEVWTGLGLVVFPFD